MKRFRLIVVLGILLFDARLCFGQANWYNDANVQAIEDMIETGPNFDTSSPWKNRTRSRRCSRRQGNSDDESVSSEVRNNMIEIIRQNTEKERRRTEAANKQMRIKEEQRKVKMAEFESDNMALKEDLRPIRDGQMLASNKLGLRGLDYNDKVVYNNISTTIIQEEETAVQPPKLLAVPKPTQRIYKDYNAYLVAAQKNTKPSYYQGNGLFSIGGGLDFDEIKEIWEENAEDNLNGNIIERSGKWLKRKISNFSPMGNEVVQLYESLKRAVNIRDTEINIAERNLTAVKKAIITNDARYINGLGNAAIKDVYKLSGDAGVPQVPTDKKEVVGWFQKFLLNIDKHLK